MDRRLSTRDRRVSDRGGRRGADHRGRPLVLIVDDHADSRELIAAVLQDVGVAIAEAATGGDALRRASGTPLPSLIILDLTLPDCHGTEVVRALKAAPGTSHIPIVALSASVMPAAKQAAVASGCEAFLEKPVLPDDVVATVRRLLAAAGA